MKRTNILVVSIVFLVAAIPCLGQGFGNECTLAGTWYGGSEGTSKYVATIVPTRANHYSAVFDGAYSMAPLGFPVKTIWSSQFVKQNKGEYEYKGTAIGLLNRSAEFPPTGPPEIGAVRFHAKLDGCDTLKMVYDFFGGYFWGDKVPFRDPPDYIVAPTPFEETYRRVPTVCPVCPFAP